MKYCSVQELGHIGEKAKKDFGGSSEILENYWSRLQESLTAWKLNILLYKSLVFDADYHEKTFFFMSNVSNSYCIWPFISTQSTSKQRNVSSSSVLKSIHLLWGRLKFFIVILVLYLLLAANIQIQECGRANPG